MQTLRGGQLSGRSFDNAHYYLLVLDPAESKLVISGYQLGQLEEASKAYLEAEKAVKQRPGTDAVLVSVDSIAALERAYPNYFADTRIFLELLDQTLTGQPKRVRTGQLRLNLEQSA
jgi:hypothetical protein